MKAVLDPNARGTPAPICSHRLRRSGLPGMLPRCSSALLNPAPRTDQRLESGRSFLIPQRGSMSFTNADR